MHTEPGEPRARGDARLERVIVLQLLGGEEERGSTPDELAQELGAPAGEVDAALRALCEDGAACLQGGRARPSRAARRMDALELIGV